MAIKLPDPGNGIPEQKTGNDEWTNMKIVRDNFADQTHAASRLVGAESGRVPLFEDAGKSYLQYIGEEISPSADLSTLYAPYRGAVSKDSTTSPTKSATGLLTSKSWLNSGGHRLTQHVINAGTGEQFLRVKPWVTNPWTEWRKIYDTGNTTKDVATGFLKASSPVLHVYNDKITKIHEAEQLDIRVDKKGVGHYEIHGTTGLRKNDGWFMSPPRDMHSNVLCMVDFEEKDGVIILKTYKKKFDFDIVAIVHDYDNPMDIPEGSCVEFRFNDIPQEQTDEPAI